MQFIRVVRSVALLIVLVTPRVALAQAGGPQMPPMPKPGPEHEILKMDAGTWDAVVEFIPDPGAPPMTSKGVEVNTVGCGGLCLVTDFKGELMPGVPFHGHGVTTWNPTKKKYAGSWTDSMSMGMGIVEASYDAATKTVNGSTEGPDMTGNVVKTRTVVQYPADGRRSMTAYMPGPDGKDVQMLKITYTRQK